MRWGREGVLDVQAAQTLGPRVRLFDPGERLGWVFRDRHQYWRHFSEPVPPPIPVDQKLVLRVQKLTAKRSNTFAFGGVTLVLALFLFWGTVSFVQFSIQQSPAPATYATDFAVVFWAIFFVVPTWLLVWRPLRLQLRLALARRSLAAATVKAQRQYEEFQRLWAARRDEYNRRERLRVDEIDEFGAARISPGTHRVDLFGGSLRSWQSFLTILGASMVGTTPPVTIVDLSEEGLSRAIVDLTEAAHLQVDLQVLSAEKDDNGVPQLARTDLLYGLKSDQLTDILIESMHGDEAGGNRAERAMDSRILRAVCDSLGPDLSIGRVAEALQALMGEPGMPTLLTRKEWDQIATELFSAEYVQQAHERLRKLEAFLYPLTELGSRPGPRPMESPLRVLGVENEGVSALSDLMIDFIVQWAMREVARGGTSRTRVLIVVGADPLRRRHLERLADLCSARDVRLVYMFRHLRDDAMHLLGSGGAAIFMRLGNIEEATGAANFIGRGYRFVFSSISKSEGTSTATGRTVTQGETSTDSQGGGYSAVDTLFSGPGHRSTQWGTSFSRSSSVSDSTTNTESWNYAETTQRVYEFRVEPTEIQHLPEYGMLIVQPGPREPDRMSAECTPGIIYMPRVTTGLLPDLGPPTNPFIPRATEMQPRLG